MKRALIVDDDPQILSLLARWLVKSDYDVVTARTFADARAEVRHRAPNVVITEVRLGEFNGLQLAILAREAWPAVRLIIISGCDDALLRRDAPDLDATFMRKPLRAQALLAAAAAS